MNCFVLTFLSTALAAWPASKPSDADILAGADARIQKYRTGEIVLRVLDAEGKPLPAGTKLHMAQTRHAFLFGSNIFMLGRLSPAENQAYEKHFTELLNYATLPFYWWAYEPEAGKPNYANTEPVLKWCLEHGVTPKGHPLAWNFIDPTWLPNDSSEVMKLQLARIAACTARFQDMAFWDVVNEAANYDAEFPRKHAPRLTAAITEFGVPEYLQASFKAARRGAPHAKLIINDYITDQRYIDKVLRRLNGPDGKPLYDVIGIQCHQHRGAWGPDKTWETCERFKGLGVPLHFTETTILSGQHGWELKPTVKDPSFVWASTPEGERQQAREVVEFYTVLFSHPSVEAITWWDFTDKGAWQNAPAGFLRSDLTPKPAYDALKELIKGKWWTRADVVSSAGGEARARGFYGVYEVSADVAGRRMSGTFNFPRGASGTVEVRLK
jgi:endo-1,4-beta-xylanase